MAKKTCRRWRRWVMMSLDHDARALVLAAKRLGMKIIRAFRGDICVWNCFGLYGTPAQMAETERAWLSMGVRADGIRKREPSGAWAFDVDGPEEDWIDPFIVDGALPYLFHCSCGSTWRGYVPESHPELLDVLFKQWRRVHGGDGSDHKGHKQEYWTLGHEHAEFGRTT